MIFKPRQFIRLASSLAFKLPEKDGAFTDYFLPATLQLYVYDLKHEDRD